MLFLLTSSVEATGNTTVVFLTSGTSWTVPNDWNSSNNTIEVIGGGSSGNSVAITPNSASGAGGGYSEISNLALTPGANVSYAVGAGGTSVTSNATSVAGGDTWFNATSMANCVTAGSASCVGAKGGGAATGGTGSTGGAAGSGVGTLRYTGGSGQGGTASSGGGGAAGPNGNRGAGTTSQGGSADNGTLAGPNTTDAGGNNGSEWDSLHGSGTGAYYTTGPGGHPGGKYGGGGSTAAASSASGSGGNGLIVITYRSGLTLTGNVKFLANLSIIGTLSKASGTFEIDDPIDPANKLLYHSFVESPEARDIYNGNATLDHSGAVTIQLPDYFDALNTDVTYQFFALDQAMPNLYISQEEKNNQFSIAGGVPGGDITWEITGVRHDPYILANPIIPVVEKGPTQLVNKGTCLYAPLCQ